MKIECIVPPLIENNLLTMEEARELLLDLRGPTEKVIRLITLLQKKSQRPFHALFRVLHSEQEHNGHKEICQIVLRKCQGEDSVKKHVYVQGELHS